jgi:hypothetical protein
MDLLTVTVRRIERLEAAIEELEAERRSRLQYGG